MRIAARGLAFLMLLVPLACTTASPDDAVCIASGGLCIPSATKGSACMSNLDPGNTGGCASTYVCCVPTHAAAPDSGATEGGKDGTATDAASSVDGAKVSADGAAKGDATVDAALNG